MAKDEFLKKLQNSVTAKLWWYVKKMRPIFFIYVYITRLLARN